MMPINAVARVLDLARWAPSGDNTQPWRFEVIDDSRFVVHGSDTRSHCVYDLDGHPSQVAIGTLIETIAIAASDLGLGAEVTRRGGLPEETPTFDVALVERPQSAPSPLVAAIPLRSVQRRAMSPAPLTGEEKRALEASVDAGYRIRWFEGWAARSRMARLMFRSAWIRLSIEEAYQVHRAIIEWGRRYSRDRVPDQALGVDALSLRTMRWGMADWKRLVFMNRYFAGTWLPRIQMDLLPGLMCGAHFALVRERPLQTVDDYVEAGRQVQRVWLTATRLGLQQQPEITPLIFSRYAREGLRFTASASALDAAQAVARRAAEVIGPDLPNVAWVARIGRGEPAPSRSLRLARSDLLRADAAPAPQPRQ